MDLRVLKYFLAIAREGNITKAAEVLHITQPTLSRQIMDLEQEIGADLFIRGKRKVILTDAGVLFQQRAKEIVLLLQKTQRDLAKQNDLVGGMISIGCVESSAAKILADIIKSFSMQYSMVQYELYNSDGDDIREKLDQGYIDIGILIEPVETTKYDFIQLPILERWGILMHRDDPLAIKDYIDISDIFELPIIIPRRSTEKEEVISWINMEAEELRIIASYNLLTNVLFLISNGIGYALCIEGAYAIRKSSEFYFLPFSPERVARHVVAWKKNKVFNSATTLFLDFLKIYYGK